MNYYTTLSIGVAVALIGAIGVLLGMGTPALVILWLGYLFTLITTLALNVRIIIRARRDGVRLKLRSWTIQYGAAAAAATALVLWLT